MSDSYQFPIQSSLVNTSGNRYPENVGILAMDVFFPKQYVSQTDLEIHDGVSPGKYTLGLGQIEQAFCDPAQDIYSLSLSAVSEFMEKNNIDYESIGHLEVGTETIMDHSKSIKTVLMQLFEKSGNTDMEGVDCINACYGGTNALFSAANWVESSAWDGRYALVVCGDIAEYAAGPARPTGGAGIVVMLVGANAALSLERGVRASHMEHAWDFYKPHLDSPFPVVDGHHSQTTYLAALDVCFQRYTAKYEQLTGEKFIFNSDENSGDHYIFHAPYNKLVQKSYARMFYLSKVLGLTGSEANTIDTALAPFSSPAFPSVLYKDRSDPNYIASLTNRDLEKAVVNLSKPSYQTKVLPTVDIPQRLGNMYTASIYAGLMSLVNNKGTGLIGKRLMMFSYGSGLAASMFSFKVADHAKQLTHMQKTADINNRLNNRVKMSAEDFNSTLNIREKNYHTREATAPAKPEHLWPNEYYLSSKDENGKRVYKN